MEKCIICLSGETNNKKLYRICKCHHNVAHMKCHETNILLNNRSRNYCNKCRRHYKFNNRVKITFSGNLKSDMSDDMSNDISNDASRNMSNDISNDALRDTENDVSKIGSTIEEISSEESSEQKNVLCSVCSNEIKYDNIKICDCETTHFKCIASLANDSKCTICGTNISIENVPISFSDIMYEKDIQLVRLRRPYNDYFYNHYFAARFFSRYYWPYHIISILLCLYLIITPNDDYVSPWNLRKPYCLH